MAGRGEKQGGGFWKRMTSRVPGSVKAVSNSSSQSSLQRGANGGSGARSRQASFNDFDKGNSEAWSDGEDELVARVRSASGNSAGPVARAPAAASASPVSGPVGAVAQAVASASLGGAAARPESASVPSATGATGEGPAAGGESHAESPAQAGLAVQGLVRAPAAARSEEPEAPSREAIRLAKFRRLLDVPSLDLGALRELSWSGIPGEVRGTVWKLLSGYLPANIERRSATVKRKREEYLGFVDQYYSLKDEEVNKKTYHQIQVDLPRTNPAVPQFQQPAAQQVLERVLYIWAIRHPGSGYVQGMNDLATPFLAVFLADRTGCEVAQFDTTAVTESDMEAIEADTFWCMSNLLDSIQDNYTFAQPGIQKNIKSLKELVSRIDAPLHAHLEEHMVEYIQFAFRWMNCLLMREIPLHCTVRLWDTYLAEVDGFASFHLYVCAAFLTTFSKQLQVQSDFQGVMTALQNLPTSSWSDEEIRMLLAEAYRWKYMFHDSTGHL